MVLLDNGMQINTITPSYLENHSLDMGPITDLLGARVACVGLGNAYTQIPRLCYYLGSSGQSPGLQ